MILDALQTRAFRNLEDRVWPFHSSVNLVLGDNGQGKTNLLEAIHVVSAARSFRAVKNQNLIRIGEPSFYVAARFHRAGLERSLSIGVSGGEERRRELLLNNAKVTAPVFVQQMPLFAYSSDLLELVRGGPDERRRFIDRGVAWNDPEHLADLSRYARVVKQRNAVIEQARVRRLDRSLLEPWDREFVDIGRRIVLRRAAYIAELQATQRAIASDHAYHVTDLELIYRPASIGLGTPEDDLRALADHLPRDLRIGYSTAGPHRDAIVLQTRHRPADEVLSSGEIKMTVLFLVLASIRIYSAVRQERPVLLLDDIDAELDLGILQRLLRFLIGTTQLFATSAKEPILRFLDFGPHRMFGMSGGRGDVIEDVS